MSSVEGSMASDESELESESSDLPTIPVPKDPNVTENVLAIPPAAALPAVESVSAGTATEPPKDGAT